MPRPLQVLADGRGLPHRGAIAGRRGAGGGLAATARADLVRCAGCECSLTSRTRGRSRWRRCVSRFVHLLAWRLTPHFLLHWSPSSQCESTPPDSDAASALDPVVIDPTGPAEPVITPRDEVPAECAPPTCQPPVMVAFSEARATLQSAQGRCALPHLLTLVPHSTTIARGPIRGWREAGRAGDAVGGGSGAEGGHRAAVGDQGVVVRRWRGAALSGEGAGG